MGIREDVIAFNVHPETVGDDVVSRIKNAIRERQGVPAHLDLTIMPVRENMHEGKPVAVWAVCMTSTCESIVRVTFSQQPSDGLRTE